MSVLKNVKAARYLIFSQKYSFFLLDSAIDFYFVLIVKAEQKNHTIVNQNLHNLT